MNTKTELRVIAGAATPKKTTTKEHLDDLLTQQVRAITEMMILGIVAGQNGDDPADPNNSTYMKGYWRGADPEEGPFVKAMPNDDTLDYGVAVGIQVGKEGAS